MSWEQHEIYWAGDVYNLCAGTTSDNLYWMAFHRRTGMSSSRYWDYTANGLIEILSHSEWL